jgi:hypothetical protein
MAWSFGDSFDLYATIADMVNGYWDSISGSYALVTGRFAGSRALSVPAQTAQLVKTSNVNDPVHHIVFGFEQTAALGSTSTGVLFVLYDGSTIQCYVGVRGDGSMQLFSSTGTVLDTYTGAFSVVSTWYGFEIEIVVNNTTGSWAVRKNGNNVNDHALGGLNTRGSSNNYANKLYVQGTSIGVASHVIDDLFWQSGATTGTWLGDIRCYARMPASDQSVTFSKSPTNILTQANPAIGASASLDANRIRFTPVTASASGPVTSLVFNLFAALTGHAKLALYDSTGTGGGPGALLGTSAELTNPGAGLITFAVSGGPTVTRGVNYWVALWSDAAISGAYNNAINYDALPLTYTTTFPSTAVGFVANWNNTGTSTSGMNVTPLNASLVGEPQEDGLTTYVYDSNPGDADFYGIAGIGSTPSQVIATVTRGYMQKSDAGTRTAAVQLKSGGTTVATPTLTLTTSGWLWAWRTDLIDPNTGAAWTAAAVNAAQIGPTVVA